MKRDILVGIQRRVAGLALLAMAAVAVPSNGCTLLVNASAHQCETTADCAGYRGTVCSERNVCVLGETSCRNNATCIDRYGSETYSCRRDPGASVGTCVNLLSADCKQILADPGDLRNDEAVVLGVYYMPSWFPLMKGGVDATELARRDFKRATGGLPGIHGGKPRPAVFVSCDVPVADHSRNRPVTEHLLEIGAQGILGPITGDWMSYALGRSTDLASKPPYLAPAFLTTANKFPGFENLPGTAGLFFTTGFPPEGRGRSYAQVARYWENALRDEGMTRDVKVAFVNPGTPTYFAITDAFKSFASVNGRTAAASEKEGTLIELGWGDTTSITDPGYIAMIAKLVAWQPDIVVCDGGGLCADVPRQLEQTKLLSSTRYVIGQEGQQRPLIDAVGSNDALRRRILGIHVGAADFSEGMQAFMKHFLDEISEPAEAQGFAAAAFDHTFELLYAISALGDQPITGRNIGRMIQTRFKAGGHFVKTYQLGSALSDALKALTAGENLDILGSTSVSHYDASGLAEYQVQVWCISSDKSRPNPFMDTGMYFKHDDDTVYGTNNCF